MESITISKQTISQNWNKSHKELNEMRPGHRITLIFQLVHQLNLRVWLVSLLDKSRVFIFYKSVRIVEITKWHHHNHRVLSRCNLCVLLLKEQLSFNHLKTSPFADWPSTKLVMTHSGKFPHFFQASLEFHFSQFFLNFHLDTFYRLSIHLTYNAFLSNKTIYSLFFGSLCFFFQTLSRNLKYC